MKYLFLLLLTCLFSSSIYSQIDEGLVLYLDMDDTVLEDKSQANNDIEIQGQFSNSCGVQDSAVVFDGSSYLNILTNTNTYFITNFTLSFYFKPQGGGTLDQTLFSKSEGCLNSSSFQVLYSPTNNSISIDFSETFQNSVSLEYELDESSCWYHVVIVRVENEHYLYVNNEQVASANSPTRIRMQNEGFFSLGNGQCVPARTDNFRGEIDEVRFYTVPYNLNQIFNIYYPTQRLITEDTLIYLGDDLTTRVTDDCTESYQWDSSPDILNPNTGETTIEPNEPGEFTYTLSFFDQACMVNDELNIIVVDPGDISCRDLSLPNTFTPNNDGLNDFFAISNQSIVEELVRFQIFDRWGGLIFETTDKFGRWDGSYQGERVPPGVYLYRVTHICEGEELVKQGSVNVLR